MLDEVLIKAYAQGAEGLSFPGLLIPGPLFTIIIKPEMLLIQPYSILIGGTTVCKEMARSLENEQNKKKIPIFEIYLFSILGLPTRRM